MQRLTCILPRPSGLQRAVAYFSSSPTTQPTQFVPGKELSEERVRQLGERDLALRRAHDTLAVTSAADASEAYRKRLIFRSKQRGWLEVDLLMGAFATQHLHSLSAEELVAYERILGRETLDLYNLILGKDAPPPELEGPLLDRIKAFVQSCPLGKADPAAYARTKGTYSN